MKKNNFITKLIDLIKNLSNSNVLGSSLAYYIKPKDYEAISYGNSRIEPTTGKAGNLGGITVIGKRPKYNYLRTHTVHTHPLTFSNALKGIDTAIGPLLHFAQPSQYVGAFRDAYEGKNPLTSMLKGNTGFFDEQYAKEHPWISTFGNLVGDVGILTAPKTLSTIKAINDAQIARSNALSAEALRAASNPSSSHIIGETVRTNVLGEPIVNEAAAWQNGQRAVLLMLYPKGILDDKPLIAGGNRPYTSPQSSGWRDLQLSEPIMNNSSDLTPELIRRGWKVDRQVMVNGLPTLIVKHPKWGFTTLEEANGTVGKGLWAKEVTNEALDTYSPFLRIDPENEEFIDELRWIARRIDSRKETPAIIQNTEEYPLYPKLWNIVLKTERGKLAYPHGATMVGRGVWPGSSQIVESSNYPSLFLGYNRDMGMPYARIGTNLGGKNNFGVAQYEKYFPKEKVEKLKEIDSKLSEYLDDTGHYLPEHSMDVYKLHHQRNLLLGDKVPEFGGFQQLLIPNDKYGDMLRTTITKGLKTGAKWEDMKVTVPALTGEEIYTDPDLIAKALAENGERMGINGVHVTNIDPTFGGFHDKGLGTEVIWGQHGSAPYLKNVYGNSFKNLLGTIELGYKKGGKFKIKNNAK